MDSGKQGSSGTSSDQEHRQEHVKEDNKSVTTAVPAKRTYECTFCKRGFTNAQALGGHMNIHRKERAKAKAAKLISTSSSIKSEEDKYCMSSRYVATISTEPRKYYPVWEAQRNYNYNYNYPMCFQQSVPNLHENNFVAPRSSQSSLSMNYQEFRQANLSLRIGPIDNEVIKRKRDAAWKEDEVDLELRLGP